MARPPALPQSSQVVRAAAVLTASYVASPDVDLPALANCMTLTFTMVKNAAAASNRARVKVTWRLPPGIYSDETVIDGSSLTLSGDQAQLRAYAVALETPPVTATPPTAVSHDLSFSIPAGKDAVRIEVLEVGDAANPGTLSVVASFQ
jgi:hypothetical protein